MPGFTPAPAVGGKAAVLAASDTLRAESTGQESTVNEAYTKVKAIEAPQQVQNSTVRTTFTLRSDTGVTVYGRIYKNGNAVGTERSTTDTSYVTYTEDLAGIDPGEELQLYIKKAAGMGGALTDNLSVKGDTDSTEDPEWKVTL